MVKQHFYETKTECKNYTAHKNVLDKILCVNKETQNGEFHAYSPDTDKPISFDVKWWNPNMVKNDVVYTLVTALKVDSVAPTWRNVLYFGDKDDLWRTTTQTKNKIDTDRSPGIWIHPFNSMSDKDKCLIHFRQSSIYDGNDGVDIPIPFGKWVYFGVVVEPPSQNKDASLKVYTLTHQGRLNTSPKITPIQTYTREESDKFKWGISENKKMYINIGNTNNNGTLHKNVYNFAGVKLSDVFFINEALNEATIANLFASLSRTIKSNNIPRSFYSGKLYDKSVKVVNPNPDKDALNMLHKQRLNCNDGSTIGVMNQFKLEQKTGGEWQYNFKCLPASFQQDTKNTNDHIYYREKTTNSEDAGNGHIDYMDRHILDCSDMNGGITLFEPNYDKTKNKLQYQYVCIGNKKPMTCRNGLVSEIPTAYKADDVQNLKNLEVKCGADEVIGKLQYRRPKADTIQYTYSCCK